MTKRERSDLDLLSERELEAALALLAPAENARAMAAAVAAIPPEERPHCVWAHEVVLAASCLSPEVAHRIREHYGRTPEEQGRIADEQRLFGAWRGTGPEPPLGVTFSRGEVVIDARNPGIGIERAYAAPVADTPEWCLTAGFVRVHL